MKTNTSEIPHNSLAEREKETARAIRAQVKDLVGSKGSSLEKGKLSIKLPQDGPVEISITLPDRILEYKENGSENGSKPYQISEMKEEEDSEKRLLSGEEESEQLDRILEEFNEAFPI